MDDGSIWRCLASTLFQQEAAAVTSGGISAGSIAVYVILIVLLIAGGAYFAGAETALASVNRTRMKSYAEDGNKKAQYVMYILNNFEKALSTILIGNNIMHIACASIVTLLTRKLFHASSHLESALVVSTIITTIVVFLIAEMLPKCHAKTCSEKQALRIGRSLYVLMKILTPLSAVFTWIGTGIKKLLFGKKGEQPSVTEVADVMGSTRQNVRKMLDVLEGKGFVALSANPLDRRTLSVALTPKTEQLFVRFQAKGDAFLERPFDGVPPEDLNVTRRTVEALLENMEGMGEEHV